MIILIRNKIINQLTEYMIIPNRQHKNSILTRSEYHCNTENTDFVLRKCNFSMSYEITPSP